MSARSTMEKILLAADVKINGNRPWDIQVKNNNFYRQLLAGGSLALGESYMAGWWDAASPDEFICRILKADIKKHAPLTAGVLWDFSVNLLTNRQSIGKSFNIGKKHYDIGNDLYAAMLDKRLIYTCGYWPKAANLDEAQEAKLELTCKKLGLKPGQTVLDIGCGWGSFAKYAAEKYKVRVIGITVSKEQKDLSDKLCQGLPVEIKLLDYRNIQGQFDHIVSLGMFEHVGAKNYRKYMKIVHLCLKDDGLFLLHTIGASKQHYLSDPWIEKYIFPNGFIPGAKHIIKASNALFIMEDWHNFGADYDKTLMAWYKNFDANWNKLKTKYDDQFYRMWKYYLLCCAGSFRARHNQLWQIVFSKRGVPGGYESFR
ncbi:MAG: cyclopropane-fatty-acyl-phospholipid synthase [Candidatus Portnoybacteria bacterium RIFCSPLOWO2_02_FULL_39_11]|uniref:Cyclopropane-fatty-acyl-phospholipid synthase n=1 Tax=Candidatus Portnoybacteria bacterium RIFCSPLOWO2_02_FULL_39_11 TaxID=1802001 RepID=A0A1G2FUJ2_9BACT|nr:MAG: cyclopropane-fatty-acyl-phospholipid synthase [Candidatus Portnoybacteria bacterium RIFCSPLOWO2_02_FULL_39_11]